MKTIIEDIKKLKKEKDAVILAHYYQLPEIQEIADYVGDSFALSKYAKELPNRTILFCGVRFMAESAKILSPEKTVLLPVSRAGCPMADMVTKEAVLTLRSVYPSAAVVCYVNSSAAVKSVCDVACTSSNAVNVVKNLEEKQVIFVPDQHLGSYVQSLVPEKEMILFKGYCPTHHLVTPEMVEKARAEHPEALFAVHPECGEEIVKLADYAGSTAGIIDFVAKSPAKEFIIGTEKGIFYELGQKAPDKTCYLLTEKLLCEDMKLTTLSDVKESLMKGTEEIMLTDEEIKGAQECLERMLSVQG